MMIHAFRKYFYWVVFYLVITNNLQAQSPINERIHFLKSGEDISAFFGDNVCFVYPKYENTDQLKKIQPVKYCISKPFSPVSLSDSLTLGCYLVAPANLFSADTIISSYHILEDYSCIQQLVVSQSSGYLGHLEELINVPFVLPPRRIKNGQHQTDLRLAVDCAELAIYGRRRQGYSIPYCGPKKITEYLIPAGQLQPGTIIHFGHQVSVLYEDRGLRGVLDGEDLLIHAYKDKAEIISLKNTDLVGRRYTLYKWE